MKHFLKKRLELAKYLMSDVPGAIYEDVVLIITAVLSACASIRWPGRNIDRKRFIELLVRHSLAEFNTSWVSIPALINVGLIKEDNTPYKGGYSARIFCDEEIDLCIDEVKNQYPMVTATNKELREYCYASLTYKWLRCGYAHEYYHHENITPFPPSRSNARISYIGRSMNGKQKRMISFHIEYLFELANYHVTILPCTESQRPKTWWIDRE
jgi:hypothetical protein